MKKNSMSKGRRFLSNISSPKYKNLPTQISLLAFILATLLMVFEKFLIKNGFVEPDVFPHLLKFIFFFIVGLSGLIVMLRGELHQAFIVMKGKFARIIGFLWWIISWWITLRAFYSLHSIFSH